MDWHNARQVWSERADRERHNARKKNQYWENPEAARARMQKWREEHPEMQKELERNNRIRNSNTIREQNALWREANILALRERSRQWHAKTREIANAGRKARREANLEVEKQRQKLCTQAARLISPWLRLVSSAKSRALKYNIPFDLTEEWAVSRWTGQCELTNIPFRTDLPGSGPKTFSPSIDQIKPRAGYTQTNCRFVLWAVNALKHDGTDEDMYLVAAALIDVKFSL